MDYREADRQPQTALWGNQPAWVLASWLRPSGLVFACSAVRRQRPFVARCPKSRNCGL